ncbi:MAG: hypothetical protein J6B22_05200 [Clostridia bacterium]|nr:hypothetical protein [Clostridia bacterium]
MSVSSSAVKQIAKENLKNNYLKAFVSCLVLILAWLLQVNLAGLLINVIGNIAALSISAVIGLFLVAPLLLGVLKYFYNVTEETVDNPVLVFYWFSEKKLYIKALKFALLFILRAALWLLVLNIPSILLFAFSRTYFFELLGIAPPIWTAGLEYYSILLRNISFVAVFFIMLKFYMAPLLFVADDYANIDECMYNSSVISRKSSIDFIGLIFSSAHFILLSLFVLPMPFVLPYLLSYYVTHVKISVEEYNSHIENSKFTQMGFFE